MEILVLNQLTGVYGNIQISHYMIYILVYKDSISSESFCRAQDIISDY